MGLRNILLSKMNLLFLLSFILIQFQHISSVCVDESGNNVDWIAMYKLPRHKDRYHKPKNYIDEGVYFYKLKNFNLFIIEYIHNSVHKYTGCPTN